MAASQREPLRKASLLHACMLRCDGMSKAMEREQTQLILSRLAASCCACTARPQRRRRPEESRQPRRCAAAAPRLNSQGARAPPAAAPTPLASLPPAASSSSTTFLGWAGAGRASAAASQAAAAALASSLRLQGREASTHLLDQQPLTNRSACLQARPCMHQFQALPQGIARPCQPSPELLQQRARLRLPVAAQPGAQ